MTIKELKAELGKINHYDLVWLLRHFAECFHEDIGRELNHCCDEIEHIIEWLEEKESGY